MSIAERDVQAIKSEVAFHFDYFSDEVIRGRIEHWVDQDELAQVVDDDIRKQFKDDCDGHALLARFFCRREGIPSRLVYCRTKRGDYNSGHLVLEIEGWIIDNRSKWVTAQNDLDYQWISMSGYEKGDDWTTIKNG